MADTRLSDLSAAGALSASDLFYVVQTPGSGGEKATGAQLLTLVGTTYVPLAGGTMTGALTIASGNLTVSAGYVAATSCIANTGNLGLNAASGFIYWEAAGNTRLYQDSAGVLAQRNGTNAQTLRVYGTYTDSSNYERLSLSTTAGTSVNISAETLGTGGDNLDIVLTPAGTGKVGIGGAPSWKLSVISSTTTCDLAVKDSVGALILTTSSGAAFLTTNTASPIIFRTSSTERMRLGDNGLLSFGDVTASYPALKRSATALQFRLADDSGYADAAVRNLLQTAYQEVTEMTAPSAPAGDSVRIYAEDNGSGKTRLMALFATGAAQQLAIEP